MESHTAFVSVDLKMQNIESILSSNDANTELTSEQLDLLYQDKDFEKFAGKKEDFSKEGAAKQYQIILDYYNQIIAQANDRKQTEQDILETLRQEKEELW